MLCPKRAASDVLFSIRSLYIKCVVGSYRLTDAGHKHVHTGARVPAGLVLQIIHAHQHAAVICARVLFELPGSFFSFFKIFFFHIFSPR